MEVKVLSEKRKAQMRAYSLKRYHANKRLKGRRRDQILVKEYYKAWRIAAKQCMDCGFVIDESNYYVIDADHRAGVKKCFNMSKAHKFGMKAAIAELAKCDPVCCRCHRIRTQQRSHEFGQKGWRTRLHSNEQLTLQLQ